MKKFRLLIVAAAMMAVAFSASAQNNKFATVNMAKLFDGYYKTKMALSAMEKERADATKEIKDMAQGLDKARTEYKQLLDQANDPAISADEHQRRQEAATQKAKDVSDSQIAIEQFQRQAQAQLQEKQQRMTQNLFTEIQKAVADKAKAGGYSMVFNTGGMPGDAVVYANTDNDITDTVVTQLNAGAPIDVSKPADPLLMPGPVSGSSTNSP